MHWVDKGEKPESLNAHRENYTQRWVDYYTNGTGNKPSDSRWLDYTDTMKVLFSHLCAFCEEECKGEIDHFRPKSKFPRKVYDWSNWLFSCHDCNGSKLAKWPSCGYVNPCSMNPSMRPEVFFEFDHSVFMIFPKKNLVENKKKKAENTIRDLRLNDFHHIKRRSEWIGLVSAYFASLDKDTIVYSEAIEKFMSETIALSSFTRSYIINKL